MWRGPPSLLFGSEKWVAIMGEITIMISGQWLKLLTGWLTAFY